MHTKLELYQRVTPLAGLGIWERNLLTGETYWNQVVRQIFEVDNDDPLPLEQVIQLYHDPLQLRALLDRAMRTDTPQSADFEITTKRDSHKWIRVRIQSDYAEGRCSLLFGTVEDISAMQQLLHESEEKEQRFSQAFDHAPIGMALVAPGGRWIRVNQQLCRMLGYSAEEFVKHTFQEFTYPDDLNSDIRQMHQLLRGEIDYYSMEKRYFHTNGQVIWALMSVSLVRDAAGAPLYFVSQVKDITDSKKNLETINDQNRRLLDFAHIISHNLRSHTGNIKMLVTMISDEHDQEERDRLLEMLAANAGNMLETLSHLNDVIKVHDRGAADMVELNLRAQADRVVEILAASIRQVGATVNIYVDDNIVVYYNVAYLESVLINLLTNSLKYHDPERPLRIDISARNTGPLVILTVADNGLGIDLALHGHKLFKMYKTFHRHEDARGMGLFLVKSHVEAMGGRIYADSRPGVGTTFTIEIKQL